jgi:hypothetical protein
LNSPAALQSSLARAPDPIRTMTATGEPSGLARTRRDRDEGHTIAALRQGRLNGQSETFAACAGDVAAPPSATVAMGPDQARAPDARLWRQAAPPVTAAPDIQQPTRDYNFASRVRIQEPEVQVHIGRVEVLAVQPPAPVPRRETATRLADYLAARNGSTR